MRKKLLILGSIMVLGLSGCSSSLVNANTNQSIEIDFISNFRMTIGFKNKDYKIEKVQSGFSIKDETDNIVAIGFFQSRDVYTSSMELIKADEGYVLSTIETDSIGEERILASAEGDDGFNDYLYFIVNENSEVIVCCTTTDKNMIKLFDDIYIDNVELNLEDPNESLTQDSTENSTEEDSIEDNSIEEDSTE